MLSPAMRVPPIRLKYFAIFTVSRNTFLMAFGFIGIAISTSYAMALVGILSFSHVLKWLFKNYHNVTLALLTGFIFGSLNKIWPWKEVLTWRENSAGHFVPLMEKSISPYSYNGNPQIVLAITLMFIGFLTIFILEKIGSKKA